MIKVNLPFLYSLMKKKISLESFRSFRGPLFLKPVTGQELFFAVSYSKPALVFYFCFICNFYLYFLYSGHCNPLLITDRS